MKLKAFCWILIIVAIAGISMAITRAVYEPSEKEIRYIVENFK